MESVLDAIWEAPQFSEAPSEEELDALAVNAQVRLCDGFEYFWIKIVQIDHVTGEILGEVHTNDFHDDKTYGYVFGDITRFHKRHVHEILDKDGFLMQLYMFRGDQAFDILPHADTRRLRFLISQWERCNGGLDDLQKIEGRRSPCST